MFFNRFRRRRRTAPSSQPGPMPRSSKKPIFPGLSDERGMELRKELRRNFAEQGAAIHFDGMAGVVQHPSRGRIRVGFENLVRMLADNQHPHAVAAHAESFARAVMEEDGTETLSAPDIYAGLRLKLSPTWGLNAEEQAIVDAATMEGFTEDIAVSLVLDTENAIQTVALDKIEGFDDLPSLRRAAATNLRGELLAADVEAVRHPGSPQSPGAHFWSFESDSFYLGSAPLFLEEMLARWAPELDQSNGILFAVPNRHLMLAREVSTGQDLLQGLQQIALLAARFGLERSHPISPSLHLSYAEGLETVSHIDPGAQELKIMPNAHLTHQLNLG